MAKKLKRLSFEQANPNRLAYKLEEDFDFRQFTSYKFNFNLNDYQVHCLKFLLRFDTKSVTNKFGNSTRLSQKSLGKSLVSMACGLGKTLVAIILMRVMKVSLCKHFLVVVPVYLCTQWKEEVKKWETKLNLLLLTNSYLSFGYCNGGEVCRYE